MKINKAYKFRLKPTKEQEVLLIKTFGCTRFVWNKMLSERKILYETNKDNLIKQKLPTPAKYKTDFEWLKEVDSLALANAQLNLQAAYNNFFRDEEVGFPKFKSKHSKKNSYTTNNQGGNIRIENNKIKLPKLGFVSLILHREIKGEIKSCTISKTAGGRYNISILVDYQQEITPVIPKRILGLDMDMKELFTDNQGNRASYPRFYRQKQQKLAKAQRKLSKRKLRSKNYTKQKQKIARINEKIACQRKDFLHKLSRRLADNYDMICIEDLNMQAMSQTLNLGKSVCDNAWGMFTLFLKYKLEEQGKYLVKINKWYPSSKTCFSCKSIYKELALNEKAWVCKNCGKEHDRDINAALNIRAEGMLTAGTAGIACECLGQ